MLSSILSSILDPSSSGLDPFPSVSYNKYSNLFLIIISYSSELANHIWEFSNQKCFNSCTGAFELLLDTEKLENSEYIDSVFPPPFTTKSISSLTFKLLK